MSWNDNAITAAIAKNIRGLWAKLTDLESQFVGLSKQVGPAGKDGIDGRDGIDGSNGVDGCTGPRGEAGIDGINGSDGANGIDGIHGADGKDGVDGKDGETGPMPKHQWRGSKLRFQQSEKRWGKWTDLRGPAGVSGGGTVAVVGGDIDFSTLPAADAGMPDSVVVKQGGIWCVANFTQLQGWLGMAIPPGTTVNGQLVTVNGDTVFVEGT